MTKIFSISLLFIFSFLHASERNIVDSISENQRLQKLNELVIASELSNNLLDYENLTLFAPLDDAFAALSAKTYYGYLKEKNKDQLQSLINFHFVEGEFTTDNVEETINTKSINGLDLEIKKTNGILYVNGAEVVESDIKFSNGIIDCEFQHVFLCKLNIPAQNLKLQTEEVSAVRLFSFEEIELCQQKKNSEFYIVPADMSYYNVVMNEVLKRI